MHQTFTGDPPFCKIKYLNNEILDVRFMRKSCKKSINPTAFLKLKAFLESGDERNNRSFCLNGQDIQQHLILGYLQINLFIMLKLSKLTADRIE